MTFDDAVRQALSEMVIPGAPQHQGDIAAAARHVNVCSYCALKLHDRLAELIDGESDSSHNLRAEALE